MNFQSIRQLGILLMAVSVVFPVTALSTLFFFEPYYLPEDTSTRETMHQQLERFYRGKRDTYNSNLEERLTRPPANVPRVTLPHMYTWPYRWLFQPLAVIGVSLFVTGLLIVYHDDIF